MNPPLQPESIDALSAAGGLLHLPWFLIAMAVLWIAGALSPPGRHPASTYIALAVLIVGAFLANRSLLLLTPRGVHALFVGDGALIVDRLGAFLSMVAILPALVGIALLHHRAATHAGADRRELEEQALVIAATAGACVTACAADMTILWLGLELMWMPLVLFIALARPDPLSAASALKAFLPGVAGSGLLLIGLVYFYGLSGDTGLNRTAAVLAGAASGARAESSDELALLVPALFVLAGIASKFFAFPMHSTAGDVIAGAATPVSALMTTLPLIAGCAALLRFFLPLAVSSEGPVVPLAGLANAPAPAWVAMLEIAASLTLVIGASVAMAQRRLRRLLAFTAVAHAGYLLMAVAMAPSALAVQGALATLLSSVIALLGAFTVLAAVEAAGGDDDCDRLARTVAASPLLAIAFLIAMAGLLALPPTAGFLGRWLLVGSALDTGSTWMAGVALFSSALLLVPYARIAVVVVEHSFGGHARRAVTGAEPEVALRVRARRAETILALALAGLVLFTFLATDTLAAFLNRMAWELPR